MKTKGVLNDFPVVCVGGSAGGLDAYTRLLRHLPADMGVAIAIVNHLRTMATMLHEILPRYTQMPVELITERLVIQPDHVFIIPAQRDLHVLDGEFRLKPISKPRGWPDVITVFLRSVTQHWTGKLIAVIVSGHDGAPQLLVRILRKLLTLLLLVKRLELPAKLLETLSRNFRICLNAKLVLHLMQHLLHRLFGKPHRCGAVHLNEAAIAVVCKTRIAGFFSKTFN